MSVFISDKDTAKSLITSNFLTQITPNRNINANELIFIRDFEALQNKSQSLIIRCKNSRVGHKFLNLIIHSCSFFKQYLKSLAISIIFYIEYSVLLFYILYPRPGQPLLCMCVLRKRGQVGGAAVRCL